MESIFYCVLSVLMISERKREQTDRRYDNDLKVKKNKKKKKEN